MSEILVGTSGYSYTDWTGGFYPEGTRREDMLTVYMRRFPTVELNFSYYRIPTAQQLESMARRADDAAPDFTFSIKAHRTMTHEIGPRSFEDAGVFIDAITPLAESGRLAAVLLQFPHSFHYTVQNRRHLDGMLRRLEAFPRACEFRGREWLSESVYDGLRDRGVALVAVDEPDLEGLLPPLVTPTAPLGYIRFHGRNRADWWSGDAASRYDYLYSDEELSEWMPRIDTLANEASRIFVYFNNHLRSQAPQNAADFERLLAERDGG